MNLSTKGKLRYIDEPMSVYRKNQGGMSGDAYERAEYIIDKKIELLNYFDDFSNQEYAKEIAEKIASLNKERKDYSLKKKNKMLYRFMRPKQTLKRFFS